MAKVFQVLQGVSQEFCTWFQVPLFLPGDIREALVHATSKALLCMVLLHGSTGCELLTKLCRPAFALRATGIFGQYGLLQELIEVLRATLEAY